jgi:hypothetical protein
MSQLACRSVFSISDPTWVDGKKNGTPGPRSICR